MSVQSNRLIPSNGTATEPEDFPLITSTVVLEAGQPRTIPYRVNITNNMLEEYREHFFLTLLSTDPKVTIGQPSLANITIGESDGKKLQITFVVAAMLARQLAHCMLYN